MERSAQEDSIAKTRKTRLYGSLDCMAGSSAVALAARRLARRLCLGPQHTASDVTPRLNPLGGTRASWLLPHMAARIIYKFICTKTRRGPRGSSRARGPRAPRGASFCTVAVLAR